MENQPKNQNNLRPGVGISQDTYMRLLKNTDPQRETLCASWRGFCISLVLIVTLLSLSATVMALDNEGYIELHFYPFHNEFDPNPGIDFKDRVVSRYGLEISERVNFGKYYIFANPFIAFGDSRPQIDYNYSAKLIAVNLKYGAGYWLSDNLDVKTTHGHWIDLGGYAGEKLQWNSISLKYSWD